MPRVFSERYTAKIKTILFMRRGETVAAFTVFALLALAAFWFSLLSTPGVPERPPERATAGTRKETLEALTKNVAERRERLEKIFERRYPDPFAPQ